MKRRNFMATLWDAFLEDYANELWDWTPRFMLEAFWHYCNDGNKAVNKLLEIKKNLSN
jgi:hypothetical protein